MCITSSGQYEPSLTVTPHLSALGQRHLGPPLREEQRVIVVPTAVTAPAIRNIHLQLKPPVGAPAVRDDPDHLVSRLTSAETVVEIDIITGNDDEPFLGEPVAESSRVRLDRLDGLPVPGLTTDGHHRHQDPPHQQGTVVVGHPPTWPNARGDRGKRGDTKI